MPVITVRTERFVEIVNRSSRDRVQRRRHGRREDRRYDETRESGRHVFRNEVGKHAIAARERKSRVGCGGITWISERMVESKQQHADKQKPDELREYDRATRQQRYSRAP